MRAGPLVFTSARTLPPTVMCIIDVGAASGGGLSEDRLDRLERLPEARLDRLERLPEDRLDKLERLPEDGLSEGESSQGESSEGECSSGVMRRRFRRGSLALAAGAEFRRLRVWEGEDSDKVRGPADGFGARRGRCLYNDLVK